MNSPHVISPPASTLLITVPPLPWSMAEYSPHLFFFFFQVLSPIFFLAVGGVKTNLRKCGIGCSKNHLPESTRKKPENLTEERKGEKTQRASCSRFLIYIQSPGPDLCFETSHWQRKKNQKKKNRKKKEKENRRAKGKKERVTPLANFFCS